MIAFSWPLYVDYESCHIRKPTFINLFRTIISFTIKRFLLDRTALEILNNQRVCAIMPENIQLMKTLHTVWNVFKLLIALKNNNKLTGYNCMIRTNKIFPINNINETSLFLLVKENGQA